MHKFTGMLKPLRLTVFIIRKYEHILNINQSHIVLAFVKKGESMRIATMF